MELPPAPEDSRLTPRPALLVVDDDQYVRVTITRALAYEGYELLEAADGLQALALLQEERAGGSAW